MFVVSVDVEIEDAAKLLSYLEDEGRHEDWFESIAIALDESIRQGKVEMKEVGMEVPDGV